ncbi:helix-turn-helix domain-containing protein [Nonomuraea turcica]|uniref:helix-turn-helix domain-containing protein n=1 Tax=Nonomuraea sp. G32 TaxID=3067274 RepID=UPI00273ACF9D|nr:helix-turn-helix domain-containing protein [Nonomuraea sp. G32]MDP4510239.1 helix-turn-helix domain-containing protein [Nonomuraea sp. G32]
MLTQPDATVSSIARLLGVSRSTIYKYLPELKPDGPAAIEIPIARAELEAPGG